MILKINFLYLSSLILILLFTGYPGIGKESKEWEKIKSLSFLNKPFVEKKVFHNKTGSVKKNAVFGENFKTALCFNNTRQSNLFYDTQISIPLDRGIKKGDVVLLQFYARGSAIGNETGEGKVQVYLQQSSLPWYKFINVPINVSRKWRRFAFSAVAEKTIENGKLVLCFGLGLYKQTIEVGNLQLLKFPQGTKRSILPSTDWETPGSEANAEWRKDAYKRIEKYRKANLTVKVVDKNNQPVPGAKVKVTMQKHEFTFGSPYFDHYVINKTKVGDRYRQKLFSLFNQTGPGCLLKWQEWVLKDKYRKIAMAALEKAKQNGMSLRGHCLVWPAKGKIPKDVADMMGTPQQNKVPGLVEEHIRDVIRSTKQYINEWDVVNEPFACHDLMDAFGEKIIIDWFKIAREELPTAELYINEHYILNAGGPGSPRHEKFKELIKFLQKNGAPVTGIGFQGHTGGFMNHPKKVYEILDDFAKLGLKMKVTEFDIDIDNEKAQAQYTKDFLTVVFSHPKVVGFQMWGFWGQIHWRGERAAMFLKDWTPKPNYFAYYNLVFKDWWTREEGKTDNNGIFSCRGFRGKYVVSVTKNGKTIKTNANLTSKGCNLVLTISK